APVEPEADVLRQLVDEADAAVDEVVGVVRDDLLVAREARQTAEAGDDEGLERAVIDDVEAELAAVGEDELARAAGVALRVGRDARDLGLDHEAGPADADARAEHEEGVGRQVRRGGVSPPEAALAREDVSAEEDAELERLMDLFVRQGRGSECE